MNYKVKGAIKKSKKYMIVYLILWLILNILLVMPISYSYINAKVNGAFDINNFISDVGNSISNPLMVMGETFKPEYFSNYLNLLFGFSLVYIVLVIVGMVKGAPKNEYTDIEHGSSDWSENGEQYKILSPKNGIILAEKNYLPLEKMGNINVLIVGRIRCW